MLSIKGRVEAIYVAPKAGALMEIKETVNAVENSGLQGDRYLKKTGYWAGIDECQLTLIEGETLDEISQQTGLRINSGEHRRNLITRGIQLYELRGKKFSVGEAILTFDRPRPPCSYIQSLTQVGMTKALTGTKGGICARILKSGKIRINDVIQIVRDVS